MQIKILVLFTCLAPFHSSVWSSSVSASAKVKTTVPLEVEDQKRTKELANVLYGIQEPLLPQELINIILEYDQGAVMARTRYPTTALVVMPDGKMISAGKDDGSLQIWNQDGSLFEEVKGHGKVVTSLLMISPHELISGSADKTVKLWDLDTNTCIRTFSELTSTVTSVIRLSDTLIAAGSEGQGICIWNIQTGETAKCFVARPENWWTHDRFHEIHALALLPKHRMIVSGGYRGFIKLWNHDCAERPFTFNSGLVRSIPNSGWLIPLSEVHALVALPDERIVAALSDGDIKIFAPNSGKKLAVLEGHKSDVRSLLLLSPTILVSGGEDMTIRVWNLAKGKDQCIKTFRGHTKAVIALAKIDEKRFLSGSEDGTIRTWTLE